MARFKTTTIKENLPDESTLDNMTGDDLVQPPIVLDMSEESGEVWTRFPGATYRVSKQAVDGKMEYCDKLSSADVDDLADYLQKKHQGGKFMVRVFPQGSLHPSHILHLRIAPKPTETSNNTDAGSIESRMLRDQLLFTQQMLLRMMDNRGNATPLGELADAIKILNPSNGVTPDSMLNLVLKGMDIARKAEGGLDWKSELIQVGKEMAPQIMETFRTLKGNPVAPPQQEQIPVKLEDFILKAIQYLKPQILANTLTVDLALDVALAQAANPQYAPFLEFTLNGDLDKFIVIDPQLNNEPFRTWFSQFITGLKEAYANQGVDEDDDSTGTAGNVRNVTDHGPAGTGRKPNGKGEKAGTGITTE